MKKNIFATEFEAEFAAEYERERELNRGELDKFDEVLISKGQDYYDMYLAYSVARDYGNDYINYFGNIPNENIPAVIEQLRKFGVDHFTFSSTDDNAIENVWLFLKNGCKFEGMIQISDPESMDGETIPAFVFSIESEGGTVQG